MKSTPMSTLATPLRTKMKFAYRIAALAVCSAFAATSADAEVISDFSSFSETGALLSGSNDRELSFTPSGTTVTIAHVSGGGAGQEAYLSDAFPTLTSGYRISVDLDGGTFAGSNSEKYGLAVASAEGITSRVNMVNWTWRVKTGTLQLDSFNGSGANSSVQVATPAPDTLFIERTATGWTFGSILGGTETKHHENITQVNSNNITADGSAFGIWSDLRANSSTWSVSNLTIVPEPGSLALLGLGGLMMIKRRRRD